MEGRYSTRSPAVKRLMREAQELCEPTDQYFAQPLEDNLFEWHFTIRGPADSDFQAGVYHGRIILPVDYPMKPPSIIWLTPNGRFETNKKICLSISGHHPESWQPSWSIRTALLAIIGFMPTHPSGAIGSLDYKPEERKTLAKKSHDWKCPVCGDVSEILLEPSPESSQTSQEAKELATQISFQGEKSKSAENKSTNEQTVTNPSSPLITTTVPNSDGVSNNASNFMPSASPLNGLPSTDTPVQIPGNFYPPWPCPPIGPPCNNALPSPFLYYPWTSQLMANGSIASQIPRFPFPPSHYASLSNTQFYPPGYALPPGVGMFPCPFPPPPRPVVEQNLSYPGKNVSMSVNNSSASTPNRSPETGPHSSDLPVVPNVPQPSPASIAASPTSSSVPCSPRDSPLKVNVLNELLSKVQRSSSSEQVLPSSDTELVIQAGDSKENEVIHAEATTEILVQGRDLDTDHVSTGFELQPSRIIDIPSISEALSRAFDGMEEISEPGLEGSVESPEDINAQMIGDPYFNDESIDKSQFTDSSTSISLMKKESLNESTGVEISHSEFLAEGDGESEILPVEVSDTEQRSNFERSTSSSMPDLKRKLQQGTFKSLRQRQSATARVSTDVTGSDPASTEQVISRGARQRIEAVSGDSSSANQQRFVTNGVHDGGQNHGNEIQHAHRRQQGRQISSAYDTSFFVMVGLCVTTVFIILNRLFYMVDFSDMFY
uniref:UBC core domain-containing protein n=1 Tax=Arion vulgaris TaxID=1028688 RepID=A0A0B6ZE97_9EUPU